MDCSHRKLPETGIKIINYWGVSQSGVIYVWVLGEVPPYGTSTLAAIRIPYLLTYLYSIYFFREQNT